MKPAPFAYHDPTSLAEVTALLGRLEGAKLLAGGQSLMSMMNFRFVMPDHLVDLNGVADLAYIRETGGRLEIGAMTRQRAIERSELVRRAAPVLIEALEQVGHHQTRNRGTIGGSLAHLDPAAELPGIAALYDAELEVLGPTGSRKIAMQDWALGYMTTALAPDEVLTQIAFPIWRERHGYAFLEFARRHGDFAIVGVACLLTLDGAGKIARASLAMIGVDVKPLRLTSVETLLIGKAPSVELWQAAADEARKIEAISDAMISSEYRKRLAGTFTARALARAAERAVGGAR
jgi:carbon-monoxide dehydrogenase medium subunit